LNLFAGVVFFWYEPLANLTLPIDNGASEDYSKNNGGPSQWIARGPQLSKFYLFLLLKSSWISVGDGGDSEPPSAILSAL